MKSYFDFSLPLRAGYARHMVSRSTDEALFTDYPRQPPVEVHDACTVTFPASTGAGEVETHFQLPGEDFLRNLKTGEKENPGWSVTGRERPEFDNFYRGVYLALLDDDGREIDGPSYCRVAANFDGREYRFPTAPCTWGPCTLAWFDAPTGGNMLWKSVEASTYIMNGSYFTVTMGDLMNHMRKNKEEVPAEDKGTTGRADNDVNHPLHYNQHPSGVECVDIVEHMTFNVGNAIKYLWRSGLKEGDPMRRDLLKAIWYLQRELERFDKEHSVVLKGRVGSRAED